MCKGMELIARWGSGKEEIFSSYEWGLLGLNMKMKEEEEKVLLAELASE